LLTFDLQHVLTFAKSALQWLEANPLRLAIAMAGSAISHMFFQLPGTDIRPKLKRLFPKKTKSEIEALQFFVVSIVGGIVAIALLRPHDDTASFLGGFTWYTTLQQISRKGR
jgi:hypothetical protein